MNYYDATTRAAQVSIKGMPGHLVTFNSNDEFVAVSGMYNQPTGWVGLTDIESEGTFTFAGGPESGMTGLMSAIDPTAAQAAVNLNFRLTELFWFGNQDNWKGDENCVELLASGFFNDANCRATLFYVVEYDCPGVLIPSAYGCTSTIC
jgi:hypothetical protein